MKSFKKFVYLLERTKTEEIENLASLSRFAPCMKKRKWWESPCLLKVDNWRFFVPSLGGTTAKDKHDMVIKNNNYFGTNPINLELKSFKSKLSYSAEAKEVKEKIQSLFGESVHAIGRSTQTRKIYDPELAINAMKKILDEHGIETSDDPPSIMAKYIELFKQRKTIHNEEIHVPPISIHALQEIENRWREKGIHGVFMSSGDSHHYREHSENSEDQFEQFPKSYQKAYNQVHDIIDVVSEWTPKNEKTDKKQPEKKIPSGEGMKIWSTREDSPNKLSDHNHGVAFVNSSQYRIQKIKEKENELHYFVPDHLYHDEELHTENFNEWKKANTTTVYVKTKNGYIQVDPKTLKPRKETKEITEKEFNKRYRNIKKREGAIGLATEAESKIHSGYDHQNDRHIIHQFLDDHYEMHKSKKENEDENS